MPEYVSPIQKTEVTIDHDAIDKMLETLSGVEETVNVAGKVAHDMRVAKGMTQDQLAAAIPGIKRGRLDKLDRAAEIPTAHEAYLLLRWVRSAAPRPGSGV